jgi:hypothetical protein
LLIHWRCGRFSGEDKAMRGVIVDHPVFMGPVEPVEEKEKFDPVIMIDRMA